MAPTPTENNDSLLDPTATATSSAAPNSSYWNLGTKANIAVTIVFALLTAAIIGVILVFWFHKRSQRRKCEQHKADKVGLLADENRSSMFSKDRHSSVTLYVDPDTEAQQQRSSQEVTSLIPLQVTPLEEVHDPMRREEEHPNTTTTSTGSGISGISSYSTNTTSTMMLSPLMPNADEQVRPTGRARSTSTASQRARYYESTPSNIELPPIPKIVHTLSD